LLGAVLAPTDAALGQAVVTNQGVPVRIRQAINVESGPNDGLAVPIVTLFLSLSMTSVELGGDPCGLTFAAEQIGFGLLAGVGTGYVGGRLLDSFAAGDGVDGRIERRSPRRDGVVALGAICRLVRTPPPHPGARVRDGRRDANEVTSADP
jgi:NhaP-type Na+/H+ or K+/H+ antiporter